MIPATAYHLALALERAATPRCGSCRAFTAKGGHLSEWGVCRKLAVSPVHQNWDFCREHEPMPKKPIPIPKGYKLKDGKLVKSDTAPPHVRAGRRRKAGQVTGARAAK